MRKWLSMCLAAVMLLGLIGCSGQGEAGGSTPPSADASTPAASDGGGSASADQGGADPAKSKLVIAGTLQITQLLEAPLEEMGYEVEVMAFNGLQEDAMALKEGSVDCVIKNNNQWVTVFSQENDTDIITLEPYLFSPIRALYSKKYTSLDEIPDGSTIVIATDSANQQRDLLTLQAAGLITLADEKSVSEFYTVYDIADNPKNLEIMTVDHTTAVNYLDDVAAAVCGAQNMMQAGLPYDNYLALDPNLEDYAHGLMIHEGDKDAQWVSDILTVWNTPEFAEGFNEAFKGTYLLLQNGQSVAEATAAAEAAK